MNNQNTLRPDLSRPETFAKFTAQYWGQKVLLVTDAIPTYSTNKIGDLVIVNSENVTKFCRGSIKNKGVLELTSLSDITDEDLEAIGFTIPDGTNDVEFDFQPDNYKFHWKAKKGIRIKEGYLALKDFDYLRSRGYALPFMGYSVDELIEAGYLVLKKGGENG